MTYFNTSQFLWGTFIFAVVPTALITLVAFGSKKVLDIKRADQSTQKPILPVSGMCTGFLAGLIACALWLTWGSNSGPLDFFTRGLPQQFMAFQPICFYITMITLSGLVTAKYARFSGTLLTVSAFTASGYTTFFYFGASFGFGILTGFGALIFHILLTLMLLATNGILLAVLRSRGTNSEGPL